MMDKDRLVKSFEVFAKDCQGSSPLYEFLSLQISRDEELLTLCSYAQQGQPAPNLLLGAVHHLLLNGKEHELSKYYPSLVDMPKDMSQSFIQFKDFYKCYRLEIIDILRTNLVQTNEVRRCAYLYPSFSFVHRKTKKPLALIEIGTSSGLQLLWDQYRYSYQTSDIYGNKYSDVHITSEIKGNNKPYLSSTSPPVSHRIGLDLHVNDLSNREDYLWLLSLIWPEHEERRELFKQAAHTVQEHAIDLIEGDGVSLLPQIAEQIPFESTICVFHTHVANQIPVKMKHKLLANIKQIGQSRDIFHLYNNMWDGDLHLDYFLDGSEYNQVVGKANSHGKWFTWEL